MQFSRTLRRLALILAAITSLLATGCSGTPKFSRFDELCKTAGLTIESRPKTPVKILLDRSEIYSQKSRRPLPEHATLPGPGIVDIANIKYLDERTTTGTRYRRHYGAFAFTIETHTDADAILKVKYILNEQETAAGIIGYEVTLTDIKTGKNFSKFRKFFTKSPYYFCPSDNQGKSISAGEATLFMIGLRDPYLESIFQNRFSSKEF